MAHFAKINEKNVVLDIIRVDDSDCGGLPFPDSEPIGKQFIASLGIEGNWVQTSYNKSFRGAYAEKGGMYVPEKDFFIHQQPYPSWSLNEEYVWTAPIEKPSDGKDYVWKEDEMSWVENPFTHFSDEFIE